MSERAEVVIAGGGIAGVEAALALNALAPHRIRLRLLSPQPEFELKPLAVEEPFTGEPAARRDLRAALAEIGAEFVDGALSEVDADSSILRFGYGSELSFDYLVVCTGARTRLPYGGVETFWSNRSDVPIDALLERAASAHRPLSLVVPPGTSWPLPLYEVALLARRRSEELGLENVELEILSPESRPLGIFGEVASAAVAELLEVRRITHVPKAQVRQVDGVGPLTVSTRDERLEPELVLALPELRGPFVRGLPADAAGFLRVDELGRVHGCDNVYAAGDGTDFPVKQGGLATQQADAVAEHIAMRLGAIDRAHGFEPVLRGRLFTGAETLNLRHTLGAGRDEGDAGQDHLWWPAEKVAGRYLAAWLGHTDRTGLQPPDRALEVEVAVPHEWHSEPL